MITKILTGLRANGELHLGNYLGAILPMAQMQKRLLATQELLLFVPDLHSFTTPIEHKTLYENALKNVRLYVASGIDIENPQTLVYRQSFVPAHSELTWILNCFTYYGEAQRMTQFKEKSEKLNNKEVTLGLLDYPVLMAADILLYGAKYIPLGEDQKQHLELARDLSQRFNNKFGKTFVEPADWATQQKFSKRESSVRIRSLSKPEAKMSKSIDDPKGTISLLDKPADAAKKVMSATTDSVGTINMDFKSQPGISNLLQIGAMLTGDSVKTYAKKWQGSSNYGELKKAVAGQVESFLVSFQEQYKGTDAAQVEHILGLNESKARAVAEETLLKAQIAVGLRRK